MLNNPNKLINELNTFYLYKIYNIILSTKNIISHSTKKIMFFKFKPTNQNKALNNLNLELNCMAIFFKTFII